MFTPVGSYVLSHDRDREAEYQVSPIIFGGFPISNLEFFQLLSNLELVSVLISTLYVVTLTVFAKFCCFIFYLGLGNRRIWARQDGNSWPHF